MDPIPETVEAIEEFGPFTTDNDLLASLRTSSEQVRVLVPDCVGLSVASIEHDVTFTLVATSQEVAALDALQYLASGPAVEAAKIQRPVVYSHDDPLGEDDWQLFAQGTSAASVASTLTIPILTGDRVTGSVNLYAASTNAFVGHHDALAGIFEAWAPGAVANADLDFSTRQIAEAAPQTLREDVRVQVAIGVVAQTAGISATAAHTRLREAAVRAGLSEVQLSETIIELARREDDI